ncbi:flagellar filament capping protein FliD, partial [Salmonella enterica]|uniref:flagellar filament capping protein FliD n=1 Tax=Salmonella enterica TaxID=28901 RepID=UPI00398C7811
GKETGITTKIATAVKSYLADDAFIDTAQHNVNATRKSLNKQYLSVTSSIEETFARSTPHLPQLDTMMTMLNNPSSDLT